VTGGRELGESRRASYRGSEDVGSGKGKGEGKREQPRPRGERDRGCVGQLVDVGLAVGFHITAGQA
jgi:hypothetical protein